MRPERDRPPLHPLLGPRFLASSLLVGAALWGGLVVPAAARQATPVPVADMLPLPAPLPAGEPPAGEPLAVVATTGILADLVAQVGGARVAVRSLMSANADPHDFEPAPEDLVAVEDAALIVRHGLRLDEWSESLVDSAEAEDRVVVATDGIETLAADDEEAAAFDEGDPHVWFDPTRTATMVDNITAALIAADPDGATTYEHRADAYLAQLRDLDAAIQVAIKTIPADRRKLVTSHDALAYYADRYGLEVVGTVIPGLETTAEPSAGELAALLETIANEGVPAIFAENTTSPKLAEQLATEADVAVVDDLYTDSLGDAGSGVDSYLGLMRTDTIVIVEALR